MRDKTIDHALGIAHYYMVYKPSTLYLILTLSVISAGIIAAIIGCDEKKIKTPVLGPAAGSGPIGGGDTQKIILTASPSDTITAVGEEQATAKITARVENQIGQPMPDGTAVIWSTTVGTLDSTTTTTSNGSTTVTLTFPKSFTGCSWITAKSGDTEASLEICVVNITPTPTVTPTPTATVTPTPTPTATGTPTPTPTATPLRTLTVGANPAVITLPGPPTTSIITACAFTDGVADQNLQINFTVSTNPAGVGTLNRNSAITDASGCNSGVAPNDVVFTAVSAGTATITATTTDGRTANVVILVN